MQQVFQNLAAGRTELVEVPTPAVPEGHVLVRTVASVVSAGTERMLVDFSQAHLVAKARQQPDRVRQVVDKARTDGVGATVSAVRAKLAQPLPMGYCNAGVVLEVGAGVTDVAAGDRVVSNGPHAEVVAVPRTLCATLPADEAALPYEHAAFAPLGAIALHGIRLAAPTLGERFVVTGLGLVGLLAVQLLRANGCRVLGIDLDPRRCALARTLGAQTVDLSAGQDPEAGAQRFSQDRGVDGVIVAASTRSSEPLQQAVRLCRKRGRVVLVGVTGMELDRQELFEREVSVQVSCSFGPGRYDPGHEEGATDYPVAYVRWTEGRNLDAVVDLLVQGAIDVAPLLALRVPFAEVEKAYAAILGEDPPLGVVLDYPREDVRPTGALLARTVTAPAEARRAVAGRVGVGVIGAGQFTTRTLLPLLADRDQVDLRVIASAGGAAAGVAAARFGVRHATTDIDAVLHDDGVDAVFITTRHDSHAALACRALDAGKAVFVEKPLALTAGELDAVEAAVARADSPLLCVGFNRRFAPHTVRMVELLAGVPGPRTLTATVNAGGLPADHWLHDPAVGGGRLVGEGCHFVDLLCHLASSTVTQVGAVPTAGTDPSWSVHLAFADGSVGTLAYVTSGHARHPKEVVTAFAGGRVLTNTNFRRLTGHGWPASGPARPRTQDKGHAALTVAFLRAAAGRGPAPIPVADLLHSSRTVLAAAGAATIA